MKSKKIIILCMSCNVEFFKQEEKVCKETWLSNISKNIEYFFFTVCDKDHPEEHIDYKNHKIYVQAGDGWFETFYKTKRAMALINKEYKYDFLVRTNTSTYINIPLLELFCDYLDKRNDSHIWGTELLMHNNQYYMIGKFLMFRPSHIRTILNCSEEFDKQYDADDYVFGCLFKNVTEWRQINIGYIFPRDGADIYYINNDGTEEEYMKKLLSYIVLSCKLYDEDYKKRDKELLTIKLVHNIISNNNTNLVSNLFKTITYQSTSYLDIDRMYRFRYKQNIAICFIVDHNLNKDEKAILKQNYNNLKSDYNIYLFVNEHIDREKVFDGITDIFNDVYITNFDNKNDLLAENEFYKCFILAFYFIYCITDYSKPVKKPIHSLDNIIGNEKVSIRHVDSFYNNTQDGYGYIELENFDKYYFLSKGLSYKNVDLQK